MSGSWKTRWNTPSIWPPAIPQLRPTCRPRIRQDDGAHETAESGSLKKNCGITSALLKEYLDRYGRSNKAKNAIARELAISRATLYRKLAELNLS